MSVASQNPSAEPTSARRFWSEPATGWDVAKFVISVVVIPSVAALCGFAVWLFNIYFSVQAQARDNAETRATLVKWQDAKEDRGSRLSVLESNVKALNETAIPQLQQSMNTLDGKITALLFKMGDASGRGK